jgi:hypothetical protein
MNPTFPAGVPAPFSGALTKPNKPTSPQKSQDATSDVQPIDVLDLGKTPGAAASTPVLTGPESLPKAETRGPRSVSSTTVPALPDVGLASTPWDEKRSALDEVLETFKPTRVLDRIALRNALHLLDPSVWHQAVTVWEAMPRSCRSGARAVPYLKAFAQLSECTRNLLVSLAIACEEHSKPSSEKRFALEKWLETLCSVDPGIPDDVIRSLDRLIWDRIPDAGKCADKVSTIIKDTYRLAGDWTGTPSGPSACAWLARHLHDDRDDVSLRYLTRALAHVPPAHLAWGVSLLSTHFNGRVDSMLLDDLVGGDVPLTDERQRFYEAVFAAFSAFALGHSEGAVASRRRDRHELKELRGRTFWVCHDVGSTDARAALDLALSPALSFEPMERLGAFEIFVKLVPAQRAAMLQAMGAFGQQNPAILPLIADMDAATHGRLAERLPGLGVTFGVDTRAAGLEALVQFCATCPDSQWERSLAFYHGWLCALPTDSGAVQVTLRDRLALLKAGAAGEEAFPDVKRVTALAVFAPTDGYGKPVRSNGPPVLETLLRANRLVSGLPPQLIDVVLQQGAEVIRRGRDLGSVAEDHISLLAALTRVANAAHGGGVRT